MKRLVLVAALCLPGCTMIEDRIGKLIPFDCRYTGCNSNYACIEGEHGWYCAEGAPAECPDEPKCPKGEVSEPAPYVPGGCAYTGQCIPDEETN